MPDYNYTITVPANTKPVDPVIVEMVLCKGILAGGQIFFPFGCRGYVHVIVSNGKGQLYPANAEDTFHADGVAVPLVGRYTLDTAPYKLYVQAWSPGTSYQHKPQVTIHVLSEEELSPWVMLKDLLNIMKRLMGLK